MESTVKLEKSFLRWRFYDDHKTKMLFIHLLLISEINESDGGVSACLNTTLKDLSCDTGITVKGIRTSLDKLVQNNDIEIHSERVGTKIVICHYENYAIRPKVKKKKTASTKENDIDKYLKSEIKSLFSDYYKSVFSLDYYWEKKDFVAIVQIIRKIRHSFTSAEQDYNDEKICSVFNVLLNNIPAFYRDKMSPSIINSRYNEIIMQIKKQSRGGEKQEKWENWLKS